MGRVKTRLADQIGPVAATAFYRANASAVIARLARDPRWRTELAVAPDAALGSRAWPRGAARRPQGGGDLGKRMQRILDTAAAGPVIIVGTDIPAIRPSHIAEAFRRLGSARAVLGPTPDGGYWLVGARRVPHAPRMFARVRWSSPHALADTMANLPETRAALAARLADVDDARDLARGRAFIGRRVMPASA